MTTCAEQRGAAVISFWMTALALGQTTCERIGMTDITSVEAPAVIVLGERKGTWPDLLRADRIVGRLASKGEVTLALESVLPEHQSVLDRYAQGGVQMRDLPELLQWNQWWGFSWSDYQGLVTSADRGATVVAAGAPMQPRPEDASLALPPGYPHLLAQATGEHAMPVALESTFAQNVAWMDQRIAQTALDAWDGQGWLVIVTDRLRVEGGLGVAWQAQRMTPAPVHAFVLADGESPCFSGDRVWRPSLITVVSDALNL